MEFIHVRNLEKYNPGYKDRDLKWCKLYFSAIDGDPEFELLEEIDQWRFFKFVILELKTKKPVPLDASYLIRKGFDFSRRPIWLTVTALHKFIETCNETVTQIRLDKIRKEKEKDKDARNTRCFQKPNLNELKTAFREKGFADSEAEKFLAYFDSVGWVIGASRKPMKNWRGAVATWCGKLRESGVTPRAPKSPKKNCDTCHGSGYLPDSKLKCWCWS